MGTIVKKSFQEIYSLIKWNPDDRKKVYQSWLEAPTEEDSQKCFQLAVQLRKKRLSEEAYAISKELTSKKPSLQSFNMYLITAYDLYSADQLMLTELEKIFEQAWEFSKEKEFEPNIVATMLKCCNKLIDLGSVQPNRFEEIYSQWKEISEQSNSFILAQYYLYLISQGKKEEVLASFDNLSPELRSNQMLRKLCKSGESSTMNGSEANSEQKATIISSPEQIGKLSDMLMCFSMQPFGIGISSGNIIDKLNHGTFKASFAIVVIPEKDDVDVCTWAFVLGYCVHKFGKNNTLLFAENLDELKKTALSTYLTQLNAQYFQSELDVVKHLGERKILAVTK